MMMSALGALAGLALAIFLIVRKVSPVYSMIAGALVGGLLSGFGLSGTVQSMISGVRDITPAILRILSAGILSGMLIKTGAAASISQTIVSKMGDRYAYTALALSTLLLTAAGVFIDVAVITVAPIAIELGRRLKLPPACLLLAMIGGGKCGNILSPNPNTIIAAENFEAPLVSVMACGIVPALLGLAATLFILIPLLDRSLRRKGLAGCSADGEGCPGTETGRQQRLPGFWASMAGPLTAIVLLALRPLAGLVIDPLIALPAGGLVGLVTTGNWRNASVSIGYGLEKMSVVAILLVGTGTIAGIIKESSITDFVIGLIENGRLGGVVMAPLAGILMSAATASTTAGATLSSASFAQSIMGSGIPAIWGAALVNAGSTVLDHLPHGSFFHATGGSMDMNIKDRMRLIPYESATGLVLTLSMMLCYSITSLIL